MMSESVTVTVQNGADPNRGAANGPIALNVLYFKSLPGIAKIAQLVLGVLCIILGSPGYHGHSFFVFVAITTFILSVIWSLVYLFSLREACRLPMNWILTELLNTLVYTVMYFVAFITILAMGSGGSSIAAGIFGIFNTMAYGVGAYFLYLEWRNSQ